MLTWIGILLVVLGVALVILAVLVWFGVIAPSTKKWIKKEWLRTTDTSWPDVLVTLLDKVPWVGLVGVALVYIGVRVLGVELAF